MGYILKGYEPKSFFEFFEDITKIPRSSGNEKEISEFLLSFAKEKGLESYTDGVHNVIIRKKGSAGRENEEPVVLQGHTDMVCEKNAGVIHDFSKDPLDIYEEDGFLKARGTTLGADNGVAVAMMMALLSDDSISAPPLECVFTVQEETGLTGAVEIAADQIRGRRMINLDSEDEGVATVSCAGGMRVRLKKKLKLEKGEKASLKIMVRGLLGGHSGMDILLYRQNSNKAMARILHRLQREFDVSIASLNGGSKDNAIPRECDCEVIFNKPAEIEKAVEVIRSVEKDIFAEVRESEPDFRVLTEESKATVWFSKADSGDVIKLLLLAPDGIRRRNVNAGNFVVASLNMGVVKTEGDELTVVFAPRSSIASLQEETKLELLELASILGFEAKVDSEYPGWSYAESSPLRDKFKECYRRLFQSELKVEAIHAGLECGIFSEKLKGLDAVAIGPTVIDCHTPNERLDLKSCEKVWALVVKVLEEI